MTLRTIIERLKKYAMATPNVGAVIVNDVFRENFWEGVDYGVVAILQQTHSVGENIATYRFQLAYIDRLTEGKGNEVDIQSDGIITISNIVNSLVSEADDVDVDGDLSFDVFNERFKDDCGGVIADVTLVTSAPIGKCWESRISDSGYTTLLDVYGNELITSDDKVLSVE